MELTLGIHGFGKTKAPAGLLGDVADARGEGENEEVYVNDCLFTVDGVIIKGKA